ncbi:HAMP domain-containing protein [Ideonella sp. 4Y11]|uniref:histidine kinase n=1 Tax=Ideonella aquatica TaxID=2824119 RepID=A0A940YE56_9BURK|nr:HAMP domain-containing sensor histidine kinase [Ideonella aquatica]MBQ0958490.1 HAMP domain-containing protein [Ideonella aquatica]
MSTPTRWHRRARQHLAHSIKWRILVVFGLLGLAVSAMFAFGAQRAFAVGWRDAARPLLTDYLAHLAQDVTGGGDTPDLARAQALVERLPLTLRIDGPRLQWNSHPAAVKEPERGLAQLLSATTADGHVLHFGLDSGAIERRPRFFVGVLLALLGAVSLAWWTLRRLLRPLDDIGAGAQRFGQGDFSQPIPVRHAHAPDELGTLAQTINTMGQDIHRMLEAKRALLLAISHELRSPLTRARLNAELLPEEGEAGAQRAALLRDLQEMASLITDLLESERLASRHAALQREPTDLPTLAQGVLQELSQRHAAAAQVRMDSQGDLDRVAVDPSRLRLLLRNLLDNALRHAGDAPLPPELLLRRDGNTIHIAVRDHGAGVDDAHLQRLSEPFYRPDSARTRTAGGVGLGLTLCRLVAEAHGGRLRLSQAHPGLRAEADVTLG